VADPHRPQPCEVANSVAVFKELSWLTRGMAKVELDRKAAGLRSARLPRLRTATGWACLIGVSKLHREYCMERAGPFCTSRDW